MKITQKIEPCLWYDGKAEEAANFYVSVFPDSQVDGVVRSALDWPAGKAGDAILVSFTIAGMQFLALNGGPDEPFNNSVSMSVTCEDQEEVNYYWDSLMADSGSPFACGWLQDKFGLRWQIVPDALTEMMRDEDREKATRVMDAMMQMIKFDIAKLKEAYEG